MMRRILIAVVTLSFLIFGAAQQVEAEELVALSNLNTILRFDSATPGTIIAERGITGLQVSEPIQGIDFRSATGELYGLARSGRIYTINTETGAATFVSILSTPLMTFGGPFGIDFNPVSDRLRVVSGDDENLRVNATTGDVTREGDLRYAAGDVNAGRNPNILASAYTNSFAGATSTLLYGIDTDLRVLVLQNPPEAGVLNTVGSLSLSAPGTILGFDISGATGIAYATLAGFGLSGSQLYTINLSTGAATLVGAIGGGRTITGIAARVGTAQPTAVPEPATMLLLGTGLAGIAAKARRRRKG